MNPPCARCKKTVYPMEKLNCLDKYWHKGCFTCEGCNMTLTMKNYKGYNKLPYCQAHYPTTKFTAVADTPENKRLAANTKKQSNGGHSNQDTWKKIVQSQRFLKTEGSRGFFQSDGPIKFKIEYHKKFEEEKGHYTSVPDDPETLRAQKSSSMASQVAYSHHSSGQSRLGIQQRSEAEVRQIQQQRRMSQEHPLAGEQQLPRQVAPPPEPQISAPPPPSGTRYIAIYDYTAADDDEVTFYEGDIIVDATVIDEGWMEGRVQRTGQYGMLPSNYVEQV